MMPKSEFLLYLNSGQASLKKWDRLTLLTILPAGKLAPLTPKDFLPRKKFGGGC